MEPVLTTQANGFFDHTIDKFTEPFRVLINSDETELTAALINWSVRTEHHTGRDFVDYVNSKRDWHVAILIDIETGQPVSKQDQHIYDALFNNNDPE